MPPTPAKYLAIHLNDHLAAALATREVAKRMASQYGRSDLGELARGLLPPLDEDLRTIDAVMVGAGVARDRFKPALAWGAEKAGRLKLNGHVTGKSPLSPLVELDGLSLGIEASVLLWRNLAAVATEHSLDVARIDAARMRAQALREDVERRRPDVARSALAPGG